jgi:hypothetical protein
MRLSPERKALVVRLAAVLHGFGAKLNTPQLPSSLADATGRACPGQQGCWIDRNRSAFRALRFTEQIEISDDIRSARNLVESAFLRPRLAE